MDLDGIEKFWILVIGIVAFTVIALVAINVNADEKANEQISKAQTCEAAVLIKGGPDVNSRLLMCSIKK